jgi:hypothetical protein
MSSEKKCVVLQLERIFFFLINLDLRGAVLAISSSDQQGEISEMGRGRVIGGQGVEWGFKSGGFHHNPSLAYGAI